MSKHEPKVSKRKYISNMITAILVSLICGAVLGFYLDKFLIARKNVLPSPVPKIPQIEQSAAEPEKNEPKLTKEEQISAVKTVLKSYYDINNAVLTKVSNESLAESKTGKRTQEEIFKDKLYKYFEYVTAKDFLDSIKEFIYGGNLKGTYYSNFFNTQEGSQIKSVNITDYKHNIIKADVVINTPNKYNTAPSATDFFGTDKGKGITETQYKKLLALKPTKLNLMQTYNGTITIENINNKWFITEYNYTRVSTEITNLSIKEKTGEKTYTLADFIKKYLSK